MAALAAGLLPLLIHLARRHPYTPLDFAALASGIASATGWLDQPLDQPLQALFGRGGAA
ncbi:hypothetical protein C7E25_22635 [Stenotrophomonas maltophilia]|nr:hypothetical protein C7E25_22635 [Stenotrophomonas maltophilia]